ncbi:MAG: ATP-binding protein [Proteobacteria bacterium]|nr:ATP-binding protein [Pseudomonadota bacterium]
MEFINRTSELEKLSRKRSKLTVLFGRRRVGKTALVMEFARQQMSADSVFYSQAIEGAESLQVSQLCADLGDLLPSVTLTNWVEFLALLTTVRRKCVVMIDEFPYLVRTSPSLPSRLQKWLDHDCPANINLILLGSSQTMMHDIFLNGRTPLFERAGEIIHVKPMGYKYFCIKLDLEATDLDSYLRYSMVGGVPKYWDYIDKKSSVLQLADTLYFEVGSRLENEPERLLKDENIVGDQAKSILELVGRGANRPSEIAARMSAKQTSLSGPLQLLRDASLLQRETPFGESTRSTKRSLYKIYDHCLAFWYGCFSPHRSRWALYTAEAKRKIILDHASKMFEQDYRGLFPHAARYWESGLEFDAVRYADADGNKLIVTEVKFKSLSPEERSQIAKSTADKFNQSQLAHRYSCSIEVIDLGDGLHALKA